MNVLMTFPIEKRINAELFIDRKQGLYLQKGDQETFLTSLKRLNRNRRGSKAGQKTLRQPVWNDITLQGRKDKLMTFEKTLSLHK